MTRPFSVLAVKSPDWIVEVHIAAGGFLAGYSGNTLLAYRQDLISFFDWCRRCGIDVFDVKRSHLELFARSLEVNGYAGATTARRLSTLSSFYRYCSEEEFVVVNPAANVRRPKLRHESPMQGLDRNELGAFLVQAGLSNERDHALACLLALNGLRVSEALGCDIADLGLERGHHTLKVIRKGGKEIVAPLSGYGSVVGKASNKPSSGCDQHVAR
jgi:integrase/recombinase XerD